MSVIVDELALLWWCFLNRARNKRGGAAKKARSQSFQHRAKELTLSVTQPSKLDLIDEGE